MKVMTFALIESPILLLLLFAYFLVIYKVQYHHFTGYKQFLFTNGALVLLPILWTALILVADSLSLHSVSQVIVRPFFSFFEIVVPFLIEPLSGAFLLAGIVSLFKNRTKKWFFWWAVAFFVQLFVWWAIILTMYN